MAETTQTPPGSPKDTAFRRMKDLPDAHLMGPGTPMCAGCGGLETVRLFQEILGTRTVFVNAAGCMTLLSSYPHTPFSGSWFYTAMASAPAGAQGVRDALDLRLARGEMVMEEDQHVVVLTGDGSAGGIGLSSTSGAIERGLDFIYLCYDNEGYGNTGHQSSASTPLGASTATAHGPAGWGGQKKDLFALWAAHNPPFVATLSPAEPVDMARKLETALTLSGPRLFITQAPCPTGWHFEPRETVHIAQLAVKTGLWPLKTFQDGRIEHTKFPQPKGKRPPVEEYLRAQGRFAHLFAPQRQEDILAKIQQDVDDYWERVASAP